MNGMRICVFGAGAIGGVLAHGLARVGDVELSLIARGEHLEAIRRNGLTVAADEQASTVSITHCTNDPAELGEQDVVFVCLKSHQAWQAAEAIQTLLGPETAVVTCQNGIPWWYFYSIGGGHEGHRLDAADRGDRQWNSIGPERAIGCVVYAAAEVTEPGVIAHRSGNRFCLGEPDGSTSERVTGIARRLEIAGFRSPVLTDIRSEVWMKLWGNLCFNPLSILTRATLDVIATDPGTRCVASAMMEEGRRIGEALGAKFGIDIEKRIDGAARVGAHRTSMLQDLEAGRPMEIDALVTAVQEMGRITGVATPNIDAILALVQQLGRVHGLYPTYAE